MAGVKHAAWVPQVVTLLLKQLKGQRNKFLWSPLLNGSMKTSLNPIAPPPPKQTLYTCDLPKHKICPFNILLAWHFVRPTSLGYNYPWCRYMYVSSIIIPILLYISSYICDDIYNTYIYCIHVYVCALYVTMHECWVIAGAMLSEPKRLQRKEEWSKRKECFIKKFRYRYIHRLLIHICI